MEAHPDQHYIDQIRKALWNQSGKGPRASVMIGAGMSMNAIPQNSAIQGFPTWSSLMEPIIDGLYPMHCTSGNNVNDLKKRAQGTSEALRLASEYEATFSRSELDHLIKTTIPDDQFTPSNLHNSLMSLRWQDVFTTNWDTLLERTTRKIHFPKYSVIRTIDDIPQCARPRIIKLHGSFPSNSPYILTEEDFRSYPITHAPFVNLVQQSIMENIFVLIGFSGNDPNFLYWSGWVRDNLGKKRPPIYLVTLESLPIGQKRLLLDRKIIPIEIGGNFAKNSGWATKCLEWFLTNLAAGQPPNIDNWPNHKTTEIETYSFKFSDSKYAIFDCYNKEMKE